MWIVQGSTGEYSDHNEWIAAAFDDEELAKTYVERITALVRSFELRGNTLAQWEQRDRFAQQMRVFDPGFSIDYTGTEYTLYEVTAQGSVPEMVIDFDAVFADED